MPDDVYTHGHADSVLRSHRWRTADNSAAYLLPHLAVDAHILDVGCGPGTITVDLARLARYGTVVGMDRSAAVVSEAAAHAKQVAVSNVDLAVGDVYSLEYDDDTFDVVHAHQLLQHLSDPVAALSEMRRVCKPGGIVAARDSDYSAFTWWPSIPELDQWLDVYRKVARSNDAEPDAGRRLKGWALDSGLQIVAATAGVWCYSSRSEVQWWADSWAERVLHSAMAEQATSRAFASEADLRRISSGWRRWASSKDAWFTVLHGEVLCRP